MLAAGASTFGANAPTEPDPKADNAATADVPEKESVWDWSATLRGGVGYKDNVLLSDFFKESSVFTFTDVEAFLFRLPTDGWEFTGVFTAEDRRYWQSESVNKEQLFLTSGDLRKKLWEDWKVGVSAQYFYNDQIFDASVAEGLPLRVRAKLHRASGGPLIEYDLGNKRRLELSFTTARMEFGEPLDDSWELGPKLLFAQKYGAANSEFTAMVQFRHRQYDVRQAPDQPGRSLEFNVPEFELGIKHYWDAAKHWRSRGRMGIELNEDNGSGFYDYRRWKISKELSFTQGGFEGMLQAKFLHYEYKSQTVPPEGKGRRRTELVLGGRVRQRIMKHLFGFAEVEYERVLATDFEERYHATTVWGGVEWEVK
ncbi:MAG TPA: hypothetical protein VM680_11515 [Verrucomicrobiae bacterium]|nr:hypothetical protein [Verrucomicrobiae bacterium]